jgi:hypothetical protein
MYSPAFQMPEISGRRKGYKWRAGPLQRKALLPGSDAGREQFTRAAYDRPLHFVPGQKFKSVAKAITVAN